MPACINGYEDIARFLIDMKSDVIMKGHRPFPRDSAGLEVIATLMLQEGARIHIVNSFGCASMVPGADR